MSVNEALSRRYGNDIVLILPLSTGEFAVFNNARELCGISPDLSGTLALWRKPAEASKRVAVTLEDLGL